LKDYLTPHNILFVKNVIGNATKKHVKNYLKAYGLGEQDVILCEKCKGVAVDIHHIQYKSQGGADNVDNLIALCRKCHADIHLAKKKNFKVNIPS